MMSSFLYIGPIVSLFLVLISLFIAYTVIRVAVRHGIDSSETGRIIKKMHQKSVRKDKID